MNTSFETETGGTARVILGCVGPEPRDWSDEGVAKPAWRVVVVYAEYEQEFWFGTESAAQEYCARLRATGEEA